MNRLQKFIEQGAFGERPGRTAYAFNATPNRVLADPDLGRDGAIRLRRVRGDRRFRALAGGRYEPHPHHLARSQHDKHAKVSRLYVGPKKWSRPCGSGSNNRQLQEEFPACPTGSPPLPLKALDASVNRLTRPTQPFSDFVGSGSVAKEGD